MQKWQPLLSLEQDLIDTIACAMECLFVETDFDDPEPVGKLLPASVVPSCFHSCAIPKTSIRDYFLRLCIHSRASASAAVVALAQLWRIEQDYPNIPIDPWTAHRLVLSRYSFCFYRHLSNPSEDLESNSLSDFCFCSFLCASKFCDEARISNRDWAYLAGGNLPCVFV